MPWKYAVGEKADRKSNFKTFYNIFLDQMAMSHRGHPFLEQSKRSFLLRMRGATLRQLGSHWRGKTIFLFISTNGLPLRGIWIALINLCLITAANTIWPIGVIWFKQQIKRHAHLMHALNNYRYTIILNQGVNIEHRMTNVEQWSKASVFIIRNSSR